MIKSLKVLAKQDKVLDQNHVLSERLPVFIQAPCELHSSMHLLRQRDYYQLNLSLSGRINIICQRCMAVFEHDYHNESQLAICANEDIAQRLMSQTDPIVNPSDEIDLEAIIIDDLHLFCPEKHQDVQGCEQSSLSHLTID